jgi:hypothetical protein
MKISVRLWVSQFTAALETPENESKKAAKRMAWLLM